MATASANRVPTRGSAKRDGAAWLALLCVMTWSCDPQDAPVSHTDESSATQPQETPANTSEKVAKSARGLVVPMFYRAWYNTRTPPPPDLIAELVASELVALASDFGGRIQEARLDASCLSLVLRIPHGLVRSSLAELADRKQVSAGARSAGRQMLERLDFLYEVGRTKSPPTNTTIDTLCLIGILSTFSVSHTESLTFLQNLSDRIRAEPSARAIATLGLLLLQECAAVMGGLQSEYMQRERRTLLVKALDQLKVVDCSDYQGSEDSLFSREAYNPSSRSGAIIANRAAAAAVARGVVIDLP